MTATRKPNLTLMILAGVFAASGASAEDRIMFATGGVQIRNAAGELRPAVKGTEIRPGDTIVTSPGGYTQAKMQAGFMAVRPDSQVRLDAPLPSLNPAAGLTNQVTLQQGAVRMIAAKQENLSADQGSIPRAAPEMMIITPNANISLSNADGEAMIAPPKVVGAAPVTFSMVNSGAVSVQGATGMAMPVAANQAVSITGKALPDMISIASIPTLPAIVPKVVSLTPTLAIVQVSPVAPSAILPTTSVPSVTPSVSIKPIASLGAPLPTLATKTPSTGTGSAPITPTLVIAPPSTIVKPPTLPMPVVISVITPVITPPPTIVKLPVLTPVITPVIAPIIKPTLTCTTVLVSRVKQQICK